MEPEDKRKKMEEDNTHPLPPTIVKGMAVHALMPTQLVDTDNWITTKYWQDRVPSTWEYSRFEDGTLVQKRRIPHPADTPDLVDNLFKYIPRDIIHKEIVPYLVKPALVHEARWIALMDEINLVVQPWNTEEILDEWRIQWSYRHCMNPNCNKTRLAFVTDQPLALHPIGVCLGCNEKFLEDRKLIPMEKLSLKYETVDFGPTMKKRYRGVIEVHDWEKILKDVPEHSYWNKVVHQQGYENKKECAQANVKRNHLLL